MQGREKYPVARQTFATLIKLLPSSALLKAGLGQYLFGTSQIKHRQNSAAKLVEGVTESLIFHILRQIKKWTKLSQAAHLQIP